MKRWIVPSVVSLITTLLFNAALALHAGHAVVWQYDAWRAKYAAEQERQRCEAWILAEFTRTNKPIVCRVVAGDGIMCYTNISIVNSYITIATNGLWWGSWSSPNTVGRLFNPSRGDAEHLPTFEKGDLELGYRPDGVVVFRTPPELGGFKSWEALRDDVTRLGRQALTNIFWTNL